MARQCWPMGQFWRVLYNQSSFIGFEEPSSYWSFQFFSAFHWSPLIGIPRIAPVSFVKTAESYERIHWSPSIGMPSMTPVSVKTTELYVCTTESYEVCRLAHHF